ncbi:D-alanyl-D-alanine carboxypeptidase family protein [Halobacillus sp. Marseille-P3879]|uniref:D-alanyl-D-alanine carboxypeptidase family protein n=1 Tax=Halobacillus TaxID=45667 RepID=UPI00210187F3|nr:D-alanyl-D-alanine carboxypeptidase family protein [Halobacillus sp. Marseille-P3879]
MIFTILFTFTIPTLSLGETKEKSPDLLSESAVVIEEQSGLTLYEKNADKEMYPASLTKIATAIYVIENENLDDKVTVSENARSVEGTRVYLEEGEEVSLEKLVQGLLINSGNDAGVAIAEHISGSEKEFAEDLNSFLEEEVGIEDTHFTNPHGLFDEDHVTTAKDLAKLTRYALKDPVFDEYFGTEELDWKGDAWETTLRSHHKLLIDQNETSVTGGKTGYVDKSGNTLATSAEKDGLEVIVITLKSESQDIAYRETRELLDYTFKTYHSTERSSETDLFTIKGKDGISYRSTSLLQLIN